MPATTSPAVLRFARTIRDGKEDQVGNAIDMTRGKTPAFAVLVYAWEDSDLGGVPVEPGDTFVFSREFVAKVIGVSIGYDTPDANEEVDGVIEALLGRNPDTEAVWRANNVLELALEDIADRPGDRAPAVHRVVEVPR